MVGHMYVEYYVAHPVIHPYPLVMIPGGGQTGTNFTGTPDGREGWAQFFIRRGFSVYVIDQVARGRSAHWSGAHGKVNDSSLWNAKLLEELFTATAKHVRWPRAKLQTQFPGTGQRGDPAFDQFYATQFPGIADFTKQQELNRDALIALVDKIGPSILMTHSQSATFGWAVGDARPDLVKGIVAIEPNGPPVHDIMTGQPPPNWYCDNPELKAYGLTQVPLSYDPPVTEDRPLEFIREKDPSDTDLVGAWKQVEPAAKLIHLARIPIGIFVGEASYHAHYDHCTSGYLKQAGVEHSFIRLTDHGIRGNGHMMMVEKNSNDIAEVIHAWMTDHISAPR